MRIHRRGRSRGQSLVEFAVSAPVLIYMLLGAFDAGVMVSDKVIAGYATRQGARLAAEIGGSMTNPTSTTSQVDNNVVQNVLAVARAMNYSTLLEIDIYSPKAANGVFNPATDLYDKFDGNGNSVSGNFPLTARNQAPPVETLIGVRLVWNYSPPSGLPGFNFTQNEYTVMRASPVLL